MTNEQLQVMARVGALRSYVSHAFTGATGGWATRRDNLLKLIAEVEEEVKQLPRHRGRPLGR
jgi:hypothetical protein